MLETLFFSVIFIYCSFPRYTQNKRNSFISFNWFLWCLCHHLFIHSALGLLSVYFYFFFIPPVFLSSYLFSSIRFVLDSFRMWISLENLRFFFFVSSCMYYTHSNDCRCAFLFSGHIRALYTGIFKRTHEMYFIAKIEMPTSISLQMFILFHKIWHFNAAAATFILSFIFFSVLLCFSVYLFVLEFSLLLCQSLV